MLSGLGCPAARDEDGLLFSVRRVRPEKMKVSTASLAILPLPLILLQIVGGWRIRITVVEVPHHIGEIE